MNKVALFFIILPISIKPFTLYEDAPVLDNFGYNDFNIQTNGELNIITQFIENNNVVFDVGASTGEWSKNVLGFKKIMLYGFEPIPKSFEMLKENIKNYPVNIFNIAFSNKNGKRTIAYYNQSLGFAELSSFYQRQEVERSCNIQPVFLEVTTYDLDTFCREYNIDAIDFLKIDTEGSELDILYGSKQMLYNHKIHYIQFEYGGTYFDAKTTLKEVFDLLVVAGYTLYRIVPQGLVKIKKWRSELENYTYSNYFASYDNVKY